MATNAENVSIWWHHHELLSLCLLTDSICFYHCFILSFSKACMPGAWGPSCLPQCNCQDEREICDRFSGNCTTGCSKGYEGTGCNLGELLTKSCHYIDVIMGAMASQITNLVIVYSTVCWGTYQRKHQSSASLAFVRGIHRWSVNSPHKWPVTRKMFLFDDVIMMLWDAALGKCISGTIISRQHSVLQYHTRYLIVH